MVLRHNNWTHRMTNTCPTMILNAGGHSPTIGDYYYEDLVSILDAAVVLLHG
jgi:hypothetical protein